LHIQYSYDDHSVVLVNSIYLAVPAQSLQVVARLINLEGSVVWNSGVVNVGQGLAANGVLNVLTLPIAALNASNELSSTFFVDLALTGGSGDIEPNADPPTTTTTALSVATHTGSAPPRTCWTGATRRVIARRARNAADRFGW
jgi:hypothetical protein